MRLEGRLKGMQMGKRRLALAFEALALVSGDGRRTFNLRTILMVESEVLIAIKVQPIRNSVFSESLVKIKD